MAAAPHSSHVALSLGYAPRAAQTEQRCEQPDRPGGEGIDQCNGHRHQRHRRRIRPKDFEYAAGRQVPDVLLKPSIA